MLSLFKKKSDKKPELIPNPKSKEYKAAYAASYRELCDPKVKPWENKHKQGTQEYVNAEAGSQGAFTDIRYKNREYDSLINDLNYFRKDPGIWESLEWTMTPLWKIRGSKLPKKVKDQVLAAFKHIDVETKKWERGLENMIKLLEQSKPGKNL